MWFRVPLSYSNIIMLINFVFGNILRDVTGREIHRNYLKYIEVG